MDLSSQAWKLWEAAQSLKCAVSPSVPILYFGDLEAFLRSKVRIVTVGLNPSLAEFPVESPYLRFPLGKGLTPRLAGQSPERYLECLSRYYDEEPYTRWFASYEPLLNGLDASYYRGKLHRVLHTDLCSPIATNPTWSRLEEGEKSQLIEGGRKLWKNLIECLDPHLVIASVARWHIEDVLPPDRKMQVVFTIPRENPYSFESCLLGAQRSARLIFGKAANTPFGTVSNRDKLRFGTYLKKQYC